MKLTSINDILKKLHNALYQNENIDIINELIYLVKQKMINGEEDKNINCIKLEALLNCFELEEVNIDEEIYLLGFDRLISTFKHLKVYCNNDENYLQNYIKKNQDDIKLTNVSVDIRDEDLIEELIANKNILHIISQASYKDSEIVFLQDNYMNLLVVDERLKKVIKKSLDESVN